MTTAQKRLRELRDRQSRERQRMVELSREESLTDETRAELDRIESGTPDLERQLRAATLAVETEDASSKVGTRDGGDAEHRARIELRSKASLGRYLAAHLKGRLPDGAGGELAQAAVDGIPLELWDVPRPETRRNGGDAETRAISPAPATTGVNLDPLRPMIFAPSIADKLMVEMPMVQSGTYATGTITTAATADAKKKGAEVPETAAAFTVETTTPQPRTWGIRVSRTTPGCIPPGGGPTSGCPRPPPPTSNRRFFAARAGWGCERLSCRIGDTSASTTSTAALEKARDGSSCRSWSAI